MIHADERSGFGEAIALNRGVAEAVPELFRCGRKRGATRNDRPEFPAEPAANRSKAPPALQKMFGFARARNPGGICPSCPRASRSRSI